MENYDFYASKFFTYLPLIIFVFIAVLLILPNSRKRFFKLQSVLPTSKIKSLAKGLVEVQGKLIMKSPLTSPVGNQECIGYYYIIEEIDRDKDGKNSYTTIHRETKCNEFEIEDDSGKISISPDGIELILLEKTNISSNNNRRYSEILLQANQEMLLVGYADIKENGFIMRKDDHYKILGITSFSGISVWNKYQPLFKSFLLTCVMIILLIIFILIKK